MLHPELRSAVPSGLKRSRRREQVEYVSVFMNSSTLVQRWLKSSQRGSPAVKRVVFPSGGEMFRRSSWCRCAFILILLLTTVRCSRDPRKYIADGKQYLAKGKYSEAIIEFR